MKIGMMWIIVQYKAIKQKKKNTNKVLWIGNGFKTKFIHYGIIRMNDQL